jgi:hypothetical protein
VFKNPDNLNVYAILEHEDRARILRVNVRDFKVCR